MESVKEKKTSKVHSSSVENFDDTPIDEDTPINENKTLPPTFSIVFVFVIIGGLFIIFTFLSLFLPNKILNIAPENINNKTDMMYTIFLFVSLFLFLSFGYIFGFLYVFLLKGIQYKKVLIYICLCVFSILFPIFIIVLFFSEFVKIFENSIGYGLLTFFQNKNINELFINDDNTTPIDNSFLITLFTPVSFGETLKKIRNSDEKKPFILNEENVTTIQNLLKYVLIKNRIGKLCWAYLASVLSVIISLKYIVQFR
jgi:hypothetical protein